jgi:hypothetical protein
MGKYANEEANREWRERRRKGRGRSRTRDLALETGAAAIAITGSLAGSGTPPTTDQLDDSQQIGNSQKRDAITDASNRRRGD